MDPKKNPFSPGAGTPPPELAGRGAVIAAAETALARTKSGRHARSLVLLGLRGVGKTVLLNRLQELAEAEGYLTVMLEAPEDKKLAAMLVPPLRAALFKLSRVETARTYAKRGLAVLRAFASAFKVSMGDVEFGVDAETGSADSGDLEADLPEVFLAVGAAAKEAGRAVALLIDEVQYLNAADLAALLVSMHKVGQKGLPVLFFGAGLPQLAALTGEAKSYAERLFEYITVGPLTDDEARAAIQAPVEREGARVTDGALRNIVGRTRGYPYFLQAWGSQAWNTAAASPIVETDAEAASAVALKRLDDGFFRVRFDRLTPREKDYMRAMAELGPGPHRSGDVAKTLGISVSTAAPLRSGLIAKGMIFSPQHGDTAFTVPMFDEFMKRAIPNFNRSKK